MECLPMQDAHNWVARKPGLTKVTTLEIHLKSSLMLNYMTSQWTCISWCKFSQQQIIDVKNCIGKVGWTKLSSKKNLAWQKWHHWKSKLKCQLCSSISYLQQYLNGKTILTENNFYWCHACWEDYKMIKF